MEKDEYRKMYEAEDTYWWYRVLHELTESYVKKIGRRDLRILDIGCGTGRVMELLAMYGTVDGVDYSEDALLFCKKRGISNIVLADVNTWTPPLETYDVVVCLDVLYTASTSGDSAIMEKIFRTLKPGGIYIMNEPAFPILRRHHDARVFGKKRYRKAGTRQMLQGAGFRMVAATYRLPLLFIIIFIKGLLERFVPPDKGASDLSTLPSAINTAFLLMGRCENAIIRRGVSLPFGSSLFIVSKKI